MTLGDSTMSTIDREQPGSAELRIERGTATRTEAGAVFQSWPLPPSDPTSAQSMGIQETAGGLQFWSDPEEDVYDLEDGDPI